MNHQIIKPAINRNGLTIYQNNAMTVSNFNDLYQSYKNTTLITYKLDFYRFCLKIFKFPQLN